mmetsp:Transcript_1093/g.1658  ORF Transcript_1093/g.1658 Transcript_1093/m.1658 type:complete len:135 (+) Transcript_1093:404-808(+)
MELPKETKHKWGKWIYQGFNRDKGFQGICNILGIERLPEYLEIVKECPLVQQNVAWEWKGDTLKYWFNQEPQIDPIELSKTPAKIISLKSNLQIFSHKFDMTIKDVNNKIRDQLYRLDILDERARKFTKTIESN